MIAGCYVLDLYCENSGPVVSQDGKDSAGHPFQSFPHQYTAEHGSTCRADARKAGWKINVRKGTALCPMCARKAHP